MEAAYELNSIVTFKLIVYTFGALVHLFLMVLILGNRRLRRLDWLLFGLIAALFLWNSGNLLALNVGLFYGVGPTVLSRVSRLIPLIGLLLVAPLLVQVHLNYLAQFSPVSRLTRLLSAGFWIPLTASPWMVGKLAGRLDLDPLQALGGYGKMLVAWLVAALLAAMAVNGLLVYRRFESDPGLRRLHAWLLGLLGTLALGFAWAFLLRPSPHQGLGGYAVTSLMLIAVAPGGLVAFAIFRYNLLDLRVQRNVIYSVAAIFGLLLYINFMRRLSGLLEAHGILPSAVTEAVMIFILVLCLEPVKKLINRLLHEAFVSEFEKVQKLATEIQDFAKQSGDVESLIHHVEQRVAAELGLEKVSLRRGGTATPGCATGETGDTDRSACATDQGKLDGFQSTAAAKSSQCWRLLPEPRTFPGSSSALWSSWRSSSRLHWKFAGSSRTRSSWNGNWRRRRRWLSWGIWRRASHTTLRTRSAR